MPTSKTLTPTTGLGRKSKIRFPNESEEYRRAREGLLVEEIELRRHIERVAAQRRPLPKGGDLTDTTPEGRGADWYPKLDYTGK